MNRYQKMKKREADRMVGEYIGQAILLLIVVGLFWWIAFAIVSAAANRSCVTATPAYAQKLGCN